MLGINIQAVASKFNLLIHKYLPRSFDKFLLGEYRKENLVGIEIGVFRGDHAVYLLKSDKIKFMYLIDEYKDYNDAGDYFVDIKKAEKKATIALAPFLDKFKSIKKNSNVAHYKFKEQSMDFVYIDGGHSYEQVKKDIENYFPLVKKGGVFGGHDFSDIPVNPGQRYGVIQAVIEFINKEGYNKNFRFFVDYYDWWVVK